MARPHKSELEIGPTLQRLQEIAAKLIETGDKARDDRAFADSISALVQATNVVVTGHQIQERHLYMLAEAEADGKSQQPSGSGGLRGRYPMGGLEDDNG